MTASPQDVLESVERRRAQLQLNIDRLRKALMHWTTWEAEYQTLKDELHDAGDPSPAQMRDIARAFDGSLFNEKEMQELLGKDASSQRSANQVVDMISRRIDYVQQNSATVEKQLDVAEKQLAGADMLLEPGVDNEEGLPMMDIEEELDEAGNEISSSVSQTGKAAAEVVEVLRKAGLQKVALENTIGTPAPTLSTKTQTSNVELAAHPQKPPAKSESETSRPLPRNKSVSFAEPVEAKSQEESEQKMAQYPRSEDERLATASSNDEREVVELDEDFDLNTSHPVIPQDESPEDAELRRQMLEYGLSEVGQIVAQLDLDQPIASYSDEESDEDFGDYTTDEEDEDEYGRNTKPVVTAEYHEQMLDLEKKLGARMLENVGPRSEAPSLAEHIGDLRTMRVQRDEQFSKALDASKPKLPQWQSEGAPKKKGVRFADDLDISEAPQAVSNNARPASFTSKAVPTISDKIVERSAATSSQPTAPSKPAKVSRFKSARAGSQQAPQMLPTPPVPEAPPIPTGPAGRTLANTITEHAPAPSEPYAPDEFDPLVINREIQADYHKSRNKFIQQQGGFKPSEEDEERPIVEERDGKTKKVSRFLAARLKADGM